jgi:hypothetical protein
MNKSVRIAAALSTLVLGASLAASTAGQAQDGTARGQNAPDCGGRQLDVTLGRLEAAAGSKYQSIRFTNLGLDSCVLQGHPTVTFRGKHHRHIGWPAEATGGPGHALLLRPGGTAATALQIPDWHNYPAADCQAKGSPRLRVVPPGTDRMVGFTYPAKTCITEKGRSLIRPVHLDR